MNEPIRVVHVIDKIVGGGLEQVVMNYCLKYLSVTAGIAGLRQAMARNDASFESGERPRVELDYTRNRGFVMDAKCILKTIGAMFDRNGSGR